MTGLSGSGPERPVGKDMLEALDDLVGPAVLTGSAATVSAMTGIEQPLVSVVVPAYNCAAFLPEALDSVFAQTLGALEVVVVDDGSTDATAEALRSCRDRRLRVARQPRQGAAAARNRGVLMARAPYLALLDADDVWLPRKLDLQRAALVVEPGLDMVFGQYEEFDDVSGSVRPAAPGYSAGTLLMRRSAFLEVGPFATTWRVGEFIDWYAPALDAGLATAMRPEVVLRRRVHADNTSRTSRQDYARVLAAMHHRRRAAAATR